jgi:hypothetical protein
MVQDNGHADGLLRESQAAERALIEAEERAERELLDAEERYRRAVEKLERAQLRVETRRRAFEQARAALDQCQLERAAGPVIRRTAVARPVLPRPARDDSRARRSSPKTVEPPSEDDGSNGANSS